MSIAEFQAQEERLAAAMARRENRLLLLLGIILGPMLFVVIGSILGSVSRTVANRSVKVGLLALVMLGGYIVISSRRYHAPFRILCAGCGRSLGGKFYDTLYELKPGEDPPNELRCPTCGTVAAIRAS